MLYVLLANIFWIIYSMIEGLREGFYSHSKVNSRVNCKFDIFNVILIQRAIFIILMSLFLVFSIKTIFKSLIIVFCMILMFGYFYYGSYYYTRHKLNDIVFKKGWKDHLYNENSDYNKTFIVDKINRFMTYKRRTYLMIIGSLLQTFIYLFV